ncbi:MAG TPA: class I SAM-dependent methyltransferase [Gemmatimonadaceae bacterium]|nr:class I SAM-dependent methyltransferase [Gemmatimonadaceae bacterium]
MPLYIPERAVVPKSEFDDPIDFYYRPLTGKIYRDRLEMSISMLGAGKSEALLEIGYGSGLLLPELARHTKRLVAIDIHGQADQVYRMLEHEGVKAELHQGNLYKMPFADGEFDALACFSVLEHLTDLDGAMREFARVTRPGAVLALGFPIRNFITDAFFRMAGYQPRKLHPSSHRDIEQAIRRNPQLSLDRIQVLPKFLPKDSSLYFSCRCTRKA